MGKEQGWLKWYYDQLFTSRISAVSHAEFHKGLKTPFIVWKYLHRFRGPFLQRPGNLTGPKWYFEIKVGCVLTSNEINFVSLATISTISEVIVRVKRNINQNRKWFYFKFSVESSSFIFNNFKTENWFKLTFEGWNRLACHLFGFTRVSFCQNLLHFTLGQWSESWRSWCRVSFFVVFLFLCLI